MCNTIAVECDIREIDLTLISPGTPFISAKNNFEDDFLSENGEIEFLFLCLENLFMNKILCNPIFGNELIN